MIFSCISDLAEVLQDLEATGKLHAELELMKHKEPLMKSVVAKADLESEKRPQPGGCGHREVLQN